MSALPLLMEVSSLFIIVFTLLHRYANFQKQNKFILIATFIAWYFSFMIVILLPMDISMTTYRQCLRDTPIVIDNQTDNQTIPITNCKEPYSIISPKYLPVLWRIIYWTSQALTWLILPFMQSFCQSGEFSLTGKIRGALISNAIYYGSYLAIFGFLLIYVAIEHNIDGPKLKVIGITASNTWGLFLLVLLLGYALVAVPRSLWLKSNTSLRLKLIYFKLAKLHSEKCEAEEQLEDILNEIRTIAEKIRYNHPFRSFVDIIVSKCPENFKNSLRRNVEDYSDYNQNTYDRDIPSEKTLVKLHYALIKSLQIKDRTSNEWYLMVEEALQVEDILLNESNSNYKFMKTISFRRNFLMDKFCNSTLEWFYYCIFLKYFMRFVSILLTCLTIMVIWSEMTFFNKKPVLSLFAIFLNASRTTYNYLSIEVIVFMTIAYLSFCAYFAIFKIRIFNYYYLAPNHHTSENSLIFSGIQICRLTSPLCYNFLGLVHLDSHITKDDNIVETQFTSIMGHMDVISVISDGFNIYFPMLILILCLANFFNLGGHILNFFGFEQFIGDEEVTQDLIEDGKNLVKREKRLLQRNDSESQNRHREVVERLRNNYSSTSIRSNTNLLNSNTDSREINFGGDLQSDQNSSSFSFKNIVPSSLPSFVSSKFRVKEYRDIPPYKDAPNDDETGTINSNRRRNDDFVDYQSGSRFEETIQDRNRLKRSENIRGIFDDV